jgi:hypothetical protein
MDSHRRSEVRVCAAVKVLEITRKDCHTEVGLTKNLSSKGLYLFTQRRWLVGSVVAFRIIYRHLSLDVLAKVMHERDDGVGFKFVNTTPNFKLGIKQIVNSLLADGALCDDRRLNRRAKAERPLVWEYNGAQFRSQMRNLSYTGTFIETPQSPELGCMVHVFVPNMIANQDEEEGLQVLGCAALVIHRTKKGFGVKFESQTVEFFNAIKAIKLHIEGK